MRDVSSLTKGKKSDIFALGYFLDSITEFTPDVASTPQNYPVFGSDDNLTGLTIDNGTLSLTFLAKDESNNAFLDLITGQDPGTVGFKIYRWSNSPMPISVWVNRKDNTNSYYRGGTLYKNFIPDPGLNAGSPDSDATRTFAGNCTTPIEITSGGIYGEMLTCSPTTNARQTVSGIKEVASGISGLQIIAVDTVSDSTKWQIEDVALSTQIFSGTGSHMIGQYILSGLTTLKTFDKIYAIYGIVGAGVYPNLPYTRGNMKYRS